MYINVLTLSAVIDVLGLVRRRLLGQFFRFLSFSLSLSRLLLLLLRLLTVELCNYCSSTIFAQSQLLDFQGKNLSSFLAISITAARKLRLYHDPRGNMLQLHLGVGFVDLLPSFVPTLYENLGNIIFVDFWAGRELCSFQQGLSSSRKPSMHHAGQGTCVLSIATRHDSSLRHQG